MRSVNVPGITRGPSLTVLANAPALRVKTVRWRTRRLRSRTTSTRPAASSVPATFTVPRARLATHFTVLSFEVPSRIRGGGGGGAGIVTVPGAERPPPLGDVNTATVALPGRATSPGVRRALRRVGDTHVVGRSAPFQRTTERNAKPRP